MPGPFGIGPDSDTSRFDNGPTIAPRVPTGSGLKSNPNPVSQQPNVGAGVGGSATINLPSLGSGYPNGHIYGLGAPAPGDVDSYIRANYPMMAAFLSNPEIGPILRRAAAEGWDAGRLYGAVQNTQWWQSTSAAQRTWQQLLAEDPAEAGRLAGQTAANVQNRAKSLGLNISAATIQSIATTATANGWTDNQLVDELLRNVNWAQLAGGDLTALRDTVKAIGGDYLVDVSDATAQSYAIAIASGEMSEAGVRSLMQRQAKERFGWMADEIDQGTSPVQFFMPIRDTIARELELAPEDVNMMDPKWMGMLEVAGDDGKPRAATLNEARLAARRDPAYANTQGAQNLMASAGAAIRDVFGRRAI